MKATNQVHPVITIAVILLIGGICFASGGNFEYWGTAEIAFDIAKDWDCTFEEQMKVRDTGCESFYHHSDLGFVYEDVNAIGTNVKLNF